MGSEVTRLDFHPYLVLPRIAWSSIAYNLPPRRTIYFEKRGTYSGGRRMASKYGLRRCTPDEINESAIMRALAEHGTLWCVDERRFDEIVASTIDRLGRPDVNYRFGGKILGKISLYNSSTTHGLLDSLIEYLTAKKAGRIGS